jgi:ABC-type Fe3+/spermidine/putrescine transport system ATPase subunit
VTVGPDTRTSDTLRVAVRPERVRIGAAGTGGTDGGSRLEGTIAQVVYLGMYTQFHVDTKAGRIVCHHLADDTVESFGPGLAVALSWETEHTTVLGDSAPTGVL